MSKEPLSQRWEQLHSSSPSTPTPTGDKELEGLQRLRSVVSDLRESTGEPPGNLSDMIMREIRSLPPRRPWFDFEFVVSWQRSFLTVSAVCCLMLSLHVNREVFRGMQGSGRVALMGPQSREAPIALPDGSLPAPVGNAEISQEKLDKETMRAVQVMRGPIPAVLMFLSALAAVGFALARRFGISLLMLTAAGAWYGLYLLAQQLF